VVRTPALFLTIRKCYQVAKLKSKVEYKKKSCIGGGHGGDEHVANYN
jgi:hypothetical protein